MRLHHTGQVVILSRASCSWAELSSARILLCIYVVPACMWIAAQLDQERTPEHELHRGPRDLHLQLLAALPSVKLKAHSMFKYNAHSEVLAGTSRGDQCSKDPLG